MKRLYNFILRKTKVFSRFIRSFIEAIDIIGRILGIVFCFMYILYLVAPILSPLLTVMFVVVGTFIATGSKQTIIISSIGLLLYTASWFLPDSVNPIIILTVCGVGIITWFFAFIKSIESGISNQLSFS